MPSITSPLERAIMAAIDRHPIPGAEGASGHAVREQLLREGFGKAEIVGTIHALVTRGWIERLRVDAADGQFYTGYRLTPDGHAVSKGAH